MAKNVLKLFVALIVVSTIVSAENPLDVRVIKELSGINLLKSPSDAAIDTDGFVYVTDTANARVVAFGPDGMKKSEFGIKGKKEGEFTEPVGIAVHAGKIFVTDSKLNTVQVFNKSGKFLYTFGGSGTTLGKLKSPMGIVISDQERVYVAENGAGRITIFTTQGIYLGTLGEGIESPTWMAMDRSGRFFVSDQRAKAVALLDRFGKKIKSLGAAETGISQPGGIAVDDRGWAVIADAAQGRIVRLDPDGKPSGSFGSPGAGRGQFNQIGGMQLGPSGTISVADSGNNRVLLLSVDLPTNKPMLAAAPAMKRVILEQVIPAQATDVAISPDGTLYVLSEKGAWVEIYNRMGQKKGALTALTEAEAARTKGARIAYGDGRIFISDQGLNRILVYDQSGRFLFSFGQRGSEKGRFESPEGIAVADKKVYVADYGNNRIQVFSIDGVYVSEIGAPGVKLAGPLDVAVRPDKKLVVAEADGQRISRITPDGKLEKVLVGPETQLLAGLQAIRIDEDGRIIALISGNKKDQMLLFDPDGKLLMRFSASGSGPGDLLDPGGLAFLSGTLYVADTGNNRVSGFVIMDVPAEPAGVKISCGDNSSTLTWNPNTESFLKGYRVYAIDESGKRHALGETTETRYTISYPLKGGESAFTLTAYSRDGLESTPIPQLTDWGRLGIVALEKKDLTAAAENFRKAVSVNDKDEFSTYTLGKTLMEMGNPDEAAAYFQKLVSSKEWGAKGRLGLGRVAFQKGKLPEAESELKKAYALNSQDPETRLYLAEVLAAQKKWDEALENAREAANLLPLEVRAHELLGVIYYKQRLYGKAEKSLLTAISLKPADANLYLELSDVYIGKNELAAARTQLEKAIEKNPNFIEARIALGTLLLSLKEVDAADAQAKKIIELDPKNASGYLLAGKVLFAKNDREGAVESFRKAMEINPNDPEASVNLATAYIELGDAAEADKVAQEALKRFPSNRDVFLVTARIREAQNDLAGALENYNKALAADPNSVEVRLRKGRLNIKRKEFQAAAAEFEQASMLLPDDIGTRIEWADALKLAGQNSKAEEVLTDAVNVDPNDPRAHFALGSLWLQMEDYTRALPELKMAAFIAPDNPEYHHTLGKAYVSSGEPESAVEELRRALDLDPKNEVIRRDLDMATASLAKYRKSTGAPPLEIVEVQISPVFAAVYKRYDSNPIGKIALRNNGAEAIFNVKVSFQVRRFQPAATTTIIDQIGPKIKRDVPLKAALSDSVLELRNDTPALGSITIEYVRKGAPQRITTTAPFVLHSRNALVWSDPAMLGAFVTPTDWPVGEFARLTMEAVGETPKGIPAVLHKSAATFEAMGAYRIGYLEDPNRPPFDTSKPDRIDTVQFPRDTLRLRYGDCDDLSVLYGSLLENLGVETAMALVPGHVLVLVNSGVATDEIAMLTDDPGQVVVNGGKVWIPVEITMVGAGFAEAWVKGAESTQKADKDGKLQVLLTHEAWKKYSPAALSMTQWLPDMPPSEELVKRVAAQEAVLSSKRMGQQTEALLAAIQANPKDSVPKLKLGILYAQNGRMDEAIEQFQAVLQNEPQNSDALADIGNVYYLKGDYQAALENYRAAEELSGNDAEIKINLSLVYYRLGNLEKAREKFEQAAEIDPDVALDNEELKKILYN